MEEDPIARDSRAAREGQLAERRDVGAHALVGEDSQQLDVRERLRPVDDECAGGGVAVGARLCPQGLLAVDEQRGAVLLGEHARRDAAEHELAAVDPGREGKEVQHVASINTVVHEVLI